MKKNLKRAFLSFLLMLTVGNAVGAEFEASDSVVTEYNKKKTLAQRFLPRPSYRRVGKPTVFVPKGQWIAGATVSYSENTIDNLKFVIIEGITTKGYNVKTEAYFGYALFNDGVLGVRGGYKRTLMDLGNANIKLNDDLNFAIQDYYVLNHSGIGMVFLRNYISLFNSMRFGLFNDLQISIEQGQGKVMSGVGDKFTGTYSKNTKFGVGISPGVSVFINDYAAVEVSVGVLGFHTEWITQTTDQIETGKYRKSAANFKVDLFSLKFGMTFYLNNKKIKLVD